jgi:hypothetical protein
MTVAVLIATLHTLPYLMLQHLWRTTLDHLSAERMLYRALISRVMRSRELPNMPQINGPMYLTWTERPSRRLGRAFDAWLKILKI